MSFNRNADGKKPWNASNPTDRHDWARAQGEHLGLKPGLRYVLVELAAFWSRRRGCIASVDTIAAATGIRRATVFDHLKELKARGLITVEHRYNDDGQQTSSKIDLAFENAPKNACAVQNLDAKGSKNWTGEGPETTSTPVQKLDAYKTKIKQEGINAREDVSQNDQTECADVEDGVSQREADAYLEEVHRRQGYRAAKVAGAGLL